jgi:hypothetical protein
VPVFAGKVDFFPVVLSKFKLPPYLFPTFACRFERFEGVVLFGSINDFCGAAIGAAQGCKPILADIAHNPVSSRIFSHCQSEGFPARRSYPLVDFIYFQIY